MAKGRIRHLTHFQRFSLFGWEQNAKSHSRIVCERCDATRSKQLLSVVAHLIRLSSMLLSTILTFFHRHRTDAMAYAAVLGAITLGLLIYVVLGKGRRGKNLPPGSHAM